MDNISSSITEIIGAVEADIADETSAMVGEACVGENWKSDAHHAVREHLYHVADHLRAALAAWTAANATED